jgi:hypothetical protein
MDGRLNQITGASDRVSAPETLRRDTPEAVLLYIADWRSLDPVPEVF